MSASREAARLAGAVLLALVTGGRAAPPTTPPPDPYEPLVLQLPLLGAVSEVLAGVEVRLPTWLGPAAAVPLVPAAGAPAGPLAEVATRWRAGAALVAPVSTEPPVGGGLLPPVSLAAVTVPGPGQPARVRARDAGTTGGLSGAAGRSASLVARLNGGDQSAQVIAQLAALSDQEVARLLAALPGGEPYYLAVNALADELTTRPGAAAWALHDQGTAGALLRVAEALDRRGDGRCLDWFKAALAQATTWRELAAVVPGMAQYLARTGRGGEAVQLWLAAAAKSDSAVGQADFRLEAARSLRALGRWAEAKPLYESVVSGAHGHEWLIGVAALDLATAALERRDWAAAEQAADKITGHATFATHLCVLRSALLAVTRYKQRRWEEVGALAARAAADYALLPSDYTVRGLGSWVAQARSCAEQVRSYAGKPVRVAPARLMLNATPGAPPPQAVAVVTALEPMDVAVDCDDPILTVTMGRWQERPLEHAAKLLVRCSGLGPRRATLTVRRANDARFACMVPVLVMGAPSWRVTPTAIVARCRAGATIRQQVLLEAGAPFSIETVASDGPFDVAATGLRSAASHRQQLPLALTCRQPTGLQSGELSIGTTLATAKTICIPVDVMVW